ncbi:MAG: hypothetical protein GXP14_13325 [Gammaproteobacteria bacterium]|nr:hypothetical protein [Gammaproteobacteria bacterium]
MIIPVNFVVGAVVVAVSTYIYKDEACKKWFCDTGTKLKNRARSSTACPVKSEEKVAVEKITEKYISVVAEAETIDMLRP